MTKTASAPTITNPATAPRSGVQRLLSLDVVRGITIAFMIMVNNNGGPGSWHFMNHAEWNGLTPTDLVFPTFAFVIGVSIVFAYSARLARGASRGELAKHTVQRAVVLIIFGIFVNSFPFFHLAHMRFYGVLQRLAICYLVCGLFYLYDQRASTKWVALAARAGGLLGADSLGADPGRGHAGPRRALHGHDAEPDVVDRPSRVPVSPVSLSSRSQRARSRRPVERSARASGQR